MTTARDTRHAPGRSLLAWAVLAIVACVVVWLVMALRHPPWWGLMDDHNHLLRDAVAIEQQGLLRFAGRFVRGNVLDWGAVRLTYPLQIAVLYGPGDPWFAALANLAWALLATWLFFWSAARALVCLEVAPARQTPALLASLATLSSLAFPWFHDVLLHPSLQDKTALLWGGLACAVLASRWLQALRPVAFGLAGGVLLLAGLAIKEQFAVALPFLVGLQLAADLRRGPWRGAWRTWVLASWGALGALALKLLAMHGSYTATYTLRRGLANLAHPVPLVVIAAALALAGHALWRWRRDRDRPALVVELSLAACLLAYLVVLAPVGWRYYVIAFAAPWLALPWARWWCGRPPRQLAALLVVTAACALVVTGHRTSRVLGSKQDLKHIVESPLLAELAARGEALWVPCEEGAVAMRHYLQAAHARPPTVLGPEAPWPPPASAVVFSDAHMCPLGERARDLAARPREVLLAPSFAGSFGVERYGPAAAP